MVSVIIPVYNVEKYIARCLESVINQTYSNLEIIVVNDATPDNSMAIVEEYAAKDNRIRIVNNPRNMGLMMTRKNGYTVSKGDYLTFVDSDDYIPANAVELMLAKATKTNADIVAGGIEFVNYHGEKRCRIYSLPFGNNSEGVCRALLKGTFAHSMCAKLFKRNLFFQHQYESFDNMTNAEDACLFYQIISHVNLVACISEPVYFYFENIGSSTRKKFSLQQIENIIQADSICLKVCKQYDSLQSLLDKYITWSIIKLYNHDFKKREISFLLKKYDMINYGSTIHALKVLSLKQIVSLLRIRILKIGR